MPTDELLALLIAERDKLNRAIEALDGTVKRRGRSQNTPAAETPGARPREKRHVSAASRRRMALAQKRRWAAVKAAKS